MTKTFKQRSTGENLVFHLDVLKTMIEQSVLTGTFNGSNKNSKGVVYANGLEAKTALIKSQRPIFELHEFVKEEFIKLGVPELNVFPNVGKRKPEIKLTGFFKSKNQDVSIVPSSVPTQSQLINWGTLSNSNQISTLGRKKEGLVLATNVRSQLSSLGKNSDTLFERMISEALNLHMIYPSMILGEIYLIPVFEYDDSLMTQNKIGFKSKKTNIEKYINFFNSINGYDLTNKEYYKYNRAALVIADFSKTPTKVYTKTQDLLNDNLISQNFNLKIEDLSPLEYTHDLLSDYQLQNPTIII